MKRQLISTQKIRNNRSEHIGQLCVPAACQMGEIYFIGWNLLSSMLGRLPQYLYASPMLNICYARFYNELIEARTGRARE